MNTRQPLTSETHAYFYMYVSDHQSTGVHCQRIRTTKYHNFYATFSNDGTTKIWDGSKVDGKTLVTKSKVTYNHGK